MATRRRPWYDTWHEDKKEFCNFCERRVECLLDLRLNDSPICTMAWRKWRDSMEAENAYGRREKLDTTN